MMTATELHSWANDSELMSVWDPFLHVNNVTECTPGGSQLFTGGISVRFTKC